MDYRRLGSSGLKVSSICLGAMNFGDQTTAAVAARIVASAYDAGINFIDTADSCARSESERIVARLIANQRDRWVLNNRLVTAVLAHKLDARDESLVDRLVAHGHLSTQGDTDPKFPLGGRIARA